MISRLSLWILVTVLTLATSCASVSQVALDAVADSLSQDGSNIVFTGDNDPKLVGEALPFALKMYESLAAGSPRHAGLARALGSLQIMYASAYVAGPSDYWGSERYLDKQMAQKRAVNLYRRGIASVLKSLDLRYPGFQTAWNSQDPKPFDEFLPRFQRADVSSLFWLSAGQLSAFSTEPMNLELAAPVPRVLQLLQRAYALDPNYQGAGLDELLVTVYSSLPKELGGDLDRASSHFDRAQSKTRGQSSGAYLAWATSVALPGQKKALFVDMLKQVLAIDASANPETTLPTLLNQERARWYLAQVDDLFLE